MDFSLKTFLVFFIPKGPEGEGLTFVVLNNVKKITTHCLTVTVLFCVCTYVFICFDQQCHSCFSPCFDLLICLFSVSVK